MDAKDRQRITTNEQYLCDNVKASSVTPHLVQDLILSLEDEQRIGFEPTDWEKVHKILRIIEEHTKGFKSFCEALRKEGMEYIADALEDVPVDEKAIERERQWSDKKIDDILKREFRFDANGKVYLGSIVEDIRFDFRQDGNAYHINDEHVIRRVCHIFPEVSVFKHQKRKEWAFRNLHRKCLVSADEEASHICTEDSSQNNTEKQSDEATLKDGNINQNAEIKPFEDLSPHELVQILSPMFGDYDIPIEASQNIIEGKITGKHFKRLKMKYMQEIFPNFTKGDKLSLINLRDDMLEETKKQSQEEKCDNVTQLEKSSVTSDNDNYIETFRRFDYTGRASRCYRKDGVLKTSNTRPSNLLEPVHFFSKLSSTGQYTKYYDISDEVVEFVAACLNERSNGTIHFGILSQTTDFYLEGKIKGLQIDQRECIKSIYRRLEERFYSDQINGVFRCVRPPQFIEVSSKSGPASKVFVVEVDVVPASSLVKEDVFFVKDKGGNFPRFYLFEDGGMFPHYVSDEKTRHYMSRSKNLVSDCRKSQEQRPPIVFVKPDLRQKMLDCLSYGEERISSDVYPLLFLSPLSDEETPVMENFEFIIDLDAVAIFDFGYSKENGGLFRFVETDKCQVLNALTTDNFDPQSIENQNLRDTHSSLLEHLRQPNIKPWIFSNGYEPMRKPPMTRKEWKQNRMKGFKEAIRFYCNEIPSGRASVIFCLLSKDYDVILEAAEDVILNFNDQWVILAETEEIANNWLYELQRRETVDKRDIERRAIIGMPWSHVNQTIHQLSGVNRPMRCEIPSSSGAFCHLKEKDRNKFYDLEIISRNECEDPEIINNGLKLSEIRRNVAETFYRGGAVTWWNFWFPDHVLKREVHSKLKLKIKEAISGQRADEDNKIGLVNIYHQPGAGGTTTAMHVLWELRTKYRCCIVKQLTEQTADQITDLRTYEDSVDPKPPIVFIDNGDEEKVGELFAVLQNKAKIEARRGSIDMKIFCVLLLCIKRTVITSRDETSVALKHDLLPKELEWFRSRHATLERQFQNKQGPDPKLLISFNILKENFNKDYIRRTATLLVNGVDDGDERRLLKYLSLLNTFDLECQPVNISAFDPIMTLNQKVSTVTFGLALDSGKRKKTDWENNMSQPLQVLLNQSCRAGLGKQLIGLSIINPLFAKEIFSCFNKKPESTSSIVMEFLNSEIFHSFNMAANEVMKVVKNIMRKREEKEFSFKVKFSPLIMKLIEQESNDTASKVLIKVYEMTQDAMICQHIARLYIHFQNWDRAAEYAQIATEIKPQNSSLWDTYGQVYKNKLLNKYIAISQQNRDLSDDEIEEAIDIAKKGITNFTKEQEVSETSEYFSKGNDAGYYGQLRMVILLLDILRFSKLGREKTLLHKCLTDKTFIPNEISNLKMESIDFMKGLEAQSEMTIQTIEEKLTQLKDDLYYSIFGTQMLAKNAVASLRENLNNYFGEESDEIPDTLSGYEKAAYRRRRVKRIGGRSLFNFLRIDAEEHLPIILDMLLENVRSEYWEIFDIINLINVAIAMKIRKISQHKLDYSELVQYSRKCYEKAILTTDKRAYLEVFMYFVLFNWPTVARQKQSLCSVDQLRDATKRWKAAFHDNHPRQKETKPIRKRETTILFLGNGVDMNSIVHYEELHDPQGKKFIKGDRVWETEDFIRKLLRLEGTLIEGTEVSCNIEMASGGISQFAVPTSVQIHNRSLWQKRICFVLGFSWAGIKAFDVREEIPEISKHDVSPPSDLGNSYQQSQMSRKSTGRIKTHDQFMETYIRLRRQIEKVNVEARNADTKHKERQGLLTKRGDLENELSRLIKAREDFFSY